MIALSCLKRAATGTNATQNSTSSHADPFHRKSLRKPPKTGQRKQQGSSKFRTQVNVELQSLPLLKGVYILMLFAFGFRVLDVVKLIIIVAVREKLLFIF